MIQILAKKRAALESLSAGRVAIMMESCNTLIKAIVIAIRYAAQRRQFSNADGVELSLLEYQTHQWRLFPYLAAAYVIKSFVHDFTLKYTNLVALSREGEVDIKDTSDMVKGVHAMVCCSKALITWTSRDAIQESREACGGHGYHKAAALGDLRSNHDPRVTFEGDNTVLTQQTSNWLLRLTVDVHSNFSVYPASEVSFLKRKDSILKYSVCDCTTNITLSVRFIMETYQWLICWLATATLQRIDALKLIHHDKFVIRNLCQVFKARTLALVFAEFMMLSFFLKKISSSDSCLKPVLTNLFYLYGTWSLYKHIPVLYQGGYCKDSSLADCISESILGVCSALKPEAVALVDAVAPPDFVLNSVLGCSDGKKVKGDVSSDKIRGIGFDATCSLVVVDESGMPLSVSPNGEPEQNVILWMDHRAKAQADLINSFNHKLLCNVGGKISLEMEIPKLLWLKENRSKKCWTNGTRYFDLPDFLTWKATGCDSRSLCSVVCKWMYEVSSDGKQSWNYEFMKQIGLESLLDDNARKIGSVIKKPGDSVGNGLTADIAAKLGLAEGTAVGTSIIDAHAGGLGLVGCHSPSVPQDINSRISLICGTSTCHMAVSEEAFFVPGIWGPYWSAMIPGLWLNEAGQSATGSLLDHIINTHPVARTIKLEQGKHIVEHLNAILEKLASKKGIPVDMLTKEIHVYPDFHGNRSPIADPTIKGMICGLDLSANEDNLAVLYLATVQALAYGTKHIMDALTKERIKPFNAILICGGLSKNKLFVKTQANISGIPVLVPEESESVLLGAAMLGATASGIYESVQSAIECMASPAEIVSADQCLNRYHEQKYKVFLKMLNDQLSYRTMMSEIKI